MVDDVSGLVGAGDLFIFHDPSRQAAFDYYFDRPAVRRIGFPTRRLGATDAIIPADLTTLDAVSAVTAECGWFSRTAGMSIT